MRRLRRLRFDGHEFRWTGRIGYEGTPYVRRCVYLRIRGGGKQGSLLAVTLVSGPSGSSGGWFVDSSYPTPREIRAVVEQALGEGWQPLVKGGGFTLRALDLPGWQLPGRAEVT
ncbi:hypothetical protein OG871_09780 [Kitasatospora sp. NBC_00374]|uniref:hypothetical protein n=1 Tax=Kitasatospora sp. NBC_00374 TaxID=2975964 RepID=UPI003244CFE5